MYNTGKESIAIDLKTDAGKALLWEILERADVLLENLSSGTLARLGFDWDELHERNPELVYCSITGYGDEGPYANLPAYDATIQGVSGWTDLIGERDKPEKMSLPAIDHATSLYAVNGILLALFDRFRTGSGQRIDISMLNVAISILGHPLAEYSGLAAHDEVEPIYGKSNEPGGIYAVKDGYISVNVTTEHWARFCEVIERPEFNEDGHTYATLAGRVKNVVELRADIEDALTERTAEEWFDRFAEMAPDIAFAPANRLPDLPEDEHVRDQNLIESRRHPVLGEYHLPRPAIRLSARGTDVSEAPGLGEHTQTILESLDLSETEIEELRDNEVVFGE